MTKAYTKPISSQAEEQLHAAARSGDVKVVSASLKEKDVNIDCRDSRGNSPLIIAARNGHAEVVTLLLKKQANPDARNTQLETALIEVCKANNATIATLLIDAGADASTQDRYRHSAEFYAAQQNNQALRELFSDTAIEATRYKLRKTINGLDKQHSNFREGILGVDHRPRDDHNSPRMFPSATRHAPTAAPVSPASAPTVTIRTRRRFAAPSS